ncbi:HupE/UreJ family protein [Thalassotalea piscium]
MFKNAFALKIIGLCLFLITNVTHAHTVESLTAELNVFPDNHYELTINVDVLHLAKNKLDFQGEDPELIYTLSSLSLIESKRLLDSIRQSIQQNSFVYFDDKKNSLPVLSGLTVAEFKRMLTDFNAYILPVTLDGSIPNDVENIAVSFAPELGNVILTLAKPSKFIVSAGQLSQSINLSPNNETSVEVNIFNTFIDYLYQGYLHIVPKGLDHILFVLALFLLARKTSTLLWQISAFTLAHTITLALGIYNVVSLPSEIVEPLIALSIAYVAIENIYQQKLTRWRLPLIFAFGLLHGLGFASVLLELGLQQEQFITSLVAFNIGVELGQLSVVLVAFSLLCWFYKKDWYQTRIVKPLSLLIALIGLYWFIERII